MSVWVEVGISEFSQCFLEQMDQKHKVCVQHCILNASLSTERKITT